MTPIARDRRIQTLCLIILTAIAIGVVLYWLRAVLVPFVLAVFLTVALTPIIEFLTERARLPHGVAALASVVFAILLLSLAGIIFSVSVARLVLNAEIYQQQMRIFLDNAMEALPLQAFGIDPSVLLAQIPAQAGAALVGTGNALIDILSNGVLVIVFVVFLMIGMAGRRQTAPVWQEVEDRVKRYIGIKFLISLATSVSVGAVLQLLGVPLAMMFALLAFLLNFIPSVGSIVATLLPLPVVLVDPSVSATTAVLAIVIPGAIQLTFGNFIEPKIYGESLDLHPVVTLMSLVLWGTLWGVVGMFLAAPMAAVIKIFLTRLEHTRPMAEAMAGRLDSLFGGGAE